MTCASCGRPSSTRVPVQGDDRRCSSCATEFWTGVVRTGSALAELGRLLEPAAIAPAPAADAVLCVDCGERPTTGGHATLCRSCRRDRIRAGVRRRDAAAA